MSTAIAWTLINRGSGTGKEYQILIVEELVVVGWGPVGRASMQYQITAAISPEEAQRFAVTQTGAKEARGYVMAHAPRSAPVEPVHLDYLRRKIGSKGRDDNIKEAMSKILTMGAPL